MTNSNFNEPHQIFSVPIWGYILNQETYHSKDYIDYVLDLENSEESKTKSNFGGFQSRDNLNEEAIFQELVETLTITANNSLKRKVVLNEMWANVNRFKDYNATHVHGGYVSGVFYLQTPEKCGNLVLCNPNVRSDMTKFRADNYIIEPIQSACILFPSWLEHYVEPNLSDEPRISLSFNFEVIHE